MNWFRKVSSGKDGDFEALADALVWFENAYEEGRKELNPSGRLEKLHARIPGLMEYYYGLLQDLEAILEWAEIHSKRTRGEKIRFYTENYARTLNQNQIKDYAETDPDVLEWMTLINNIAHVRNKYLSICKGIESLHFNLTNITNLRKAGIEDASL